MTATLTGGAGTKVGLSDPVVLSGKAIAQRIKATLGITGLSLPRVHIDGVVWHLDVGSSHPGAEVGPKGWAVRPLKRYASWVQKMILPYRGCFTLRSTSTVTVLSILSLTTLPCKVRTFLFSEIIRFCEKALKYCYIYNTVKKSINMDIKFVPKINITYNSNYNAQHR